VLVVKRVRMLARGMVGAHWSAPLRRIAPDMFRCVKRRGIGQFERDWKLERKTRVRMLARGMVGVRWSVPPKRITPDIFRKRSPIQVKKDWKLSRNTRKIG
jgi:hypothetical protein